MAKPRYTKKIGWIALIVIVVVALSYFILQKREIFTNYPSIVFYSCFYGTNTNAAFRVPALPSKDHRCYFFSNNKDLLNQAKAKGWKVIYDAKEVSDDPITSCMQGKEIKVRPHLHPKLKNATYTVFLDSKLPDVNVEMVQKLIQTYCVKQKKPFLLRKHIDPRGSIWDEFNKSMEQPRYAATRDHIEQYIKQELQTRHISPETSNFSQCGFIIRDMKHPISSKINEEWMNEIKKCGIQDQISFFFVQNQFNSNIVSFTEYPFLS